MSFYMELKQPDGSVDLIREMDGTPRIYLNVGPALEVKHKLWDYVNIITKAQKEKGYK